MESEESRRQNLCLSNTNYIQGLLKSDEFAIQKAETYINDVYNRFVIDIGVESFFDEVKQDILMYKLSKDMKDNRMISLIRKYLKCGIIVKGIVVTSE